MPAYQTITLETIPGQGGAIALITLNRPEKRNAISAGDDRRAHERARRSWNPAANALRSSPERAKPFAPAWISTRLKALAAQSPEQNLADARRTAAFFRRLWSFPKPLIAAVNGAALAGGCGIATLCDFTLAAPEAKFGYTEVRVGFMPALVSMFLERQVGEKLARDLFLPAEFSTPRRRKPLGLVTKIVPRRNSSRRRASWPPR